MNIIILTNGRASRRQYDLRRMTGLVPVAACLAGILAVAFGLGWLLAPTQDISTDQHVTHVRSTLGQERTQIRQIRQQIDQNLDAFASKVGHLSAHVIRLDALGRRLAGMAELTDGEFDFASAPPRGGPEHLSPEQLGSFSEFADELTLLGHQLEDRRGQLEILESLLLSKNLEGQVHPEGFPVKGGWISSYFGRRTDPITGRGALHMGLDFAGRSGMAITSVAAGVVNFSGTRQGFGKIVEINHGNGFVTRYAHNSKNLVAVGEKVDKGQEIALMGATGRATGPNLHFEVLQNGRAVNPIKYVKNESD